MSNAIAMKPSNGIDAQSVQRVLLGGDLSVLSAEQKVSYYNRVCELVGLNPLTQPFDYIKLNGKEKLYANKGCGEQLRSVHKISIKIVSRERLDDIYVVTAEAISADGRADSSTGAVPINGLKGEALANALMKAETKAKRRVTLSICGLNMLDDSELDSIPDAKGESDLNKKYGIKPEIKEPKLVPSEVAPAEPGTFEAETATKIPANPLDEAVITVPVSVRGKKFAEVGKADLKAIAEKCHGWYVSQKKPIPEEWATFFTQVEDYTRSA